MRAVPYIPVLKLRYEASGSIRSACRSGIFGSNLQAVGAQYLPVTEGHDKIACAATSAIVSAADPDRAIPMLSATNGRAGRRKRVPTLAKYGSPKRSPAPSSCLPALDL